MSTRSSIFYHSRGEPGDLDRQYIHIFEEPGINYPSPGIWMNVMTDDGEVLVKIHDYPAFAKAVQEGLRYALPR